MKHSNWRKVYGEVPEYFHRQLLESLEGLEEENKMVIQKRKKLTTTLIAAIVAILALTGGALAARELGVFKMLTSGSTPIVPLEGAADMVETDLGFAENDLVRLTVEEAVYDGQGALVQLRFEPKVDTEKYALMSAALDSSWGWGDSEYVVGEEEANGNIRWHFMGRKDGREQIDCNVKAVLTDAEGNQIDFGYWNGERQPDGSLILWSTGSSEAPFGERVTLRVEPSVELRVKWDEKTASGEWIEVDESEAFEPHEMEPIEATVKCSTEQRYLALNPQNRLERVEVLRAGISQSLVRGYLTVEYAYEPLPEELMGITFHLCDAAGNWISESHGSHFEEDGLFYSTMEIQSFEELPETLYLEVNVIDGPSLGRIECKVEEADVPVVTAPHLNGF